MRRSAYSVRAKPLPPRRLLEDGPSTRCELRRNRKHTRSRWLGMNGSIDFSAIRISTRQRYLLHSFKGCEQLYHLPSRKGHQLPGYTTFCSRQPVPAGSLVGNASQIAGDLFPAVRSVREFRSLIRTPVRSGDRLGDTSSPKSKMRELGFAATTFRGWDFA